MSPVPQHPTDRTDPPAPHAAPAAEPVAAASAAPSATSVVTATTEAEPVTVQGTEATSGTGAEAATGSETLASADPGAEAPAPGRSGAMRTLAAALPAGALGASLVLIAAGKTWSRGTAAFGQTRLPVHATGTETTALPGALALVGLAALVAVFAVRRAGRYAVAGLLTLSGLGVVVMVLARSGDRGPLDSAAARATGLTRATAAHTSTTSWPLVAAAGGVLLLAAGLLALRYGQSWPAMSSRYDRPGARRPVRARAAASAARPIVVDPDRAEDLWKALDRGEDPTRTSD